MSMPLEDNQVPIAAGRNRETEAHEVKAVTLGPERCQEGCMSLGCPQTKVFSQCVTFTRFM